MNRARMVPCLRLIAVLLLTTSVNGFADDAVKPGDRTVAQVCSVCHSGGLMDAPRIGDASAWRGRLKTAGSLDRLVESAEQGKGNMPARGGQSNLSEADLKAAIQYMLNKSGVGG